MYRKANKSRVIKMDKTSLILHRQRAGRKTRKQSTLLYYLIISTCLIINVNKKRRRGNSITSVLLPNILMLLFTSIVYVVSNSFYFVFSCFHVIPSINYNIKITSTQQQIQDSLPIRKRLRVGDKSDPGL